MKVSVKAGDGRAEIAEDRRASWWQRAVRRRSKHRRMTVGGYERLMTQPGRAGRARARAKVKAARRANVDRILRERGRR